MELRSRIMVAAFVFVLTGCQAMQGDQDGEGGDGEQANTFCRYTARQNSTVLTPPVVQGKMLCVLCDADMRKNGCPGNPRTPLGSKIKLLDKQGNVEEINVTQGENDQVCRKQRCIVERRIYRRVK